MLILKDLVNMVGCTRKEKYSKKGEFGKIIRYAIDDEEKGRW